MVELVPLSLSALARRALAEYRHRRAVFDLPEGAWYRPAEGLDLTVSLGAATAATPLGTGPGPHSRLAQSMVLGWLGGCRSIELPVPSTTGLARQPRIRPDGVAVEIARPVAPWPREEQLVECVKAAMLVRILHESRIAVGLAATRVEPWFIPSVPCDHTLIRTAGLTDFLAGLRDASATIEPLRRELTGELAPFAALDFTPNLLGRVTIQSTGDEPASELIETCQELTTGSGQQIALTVGATMLDFEDVEELFRDRMQLTSFAPVRAAFERAPSWEDSTKRLSEARAILQHHGGELALTIAAAVPVTTADAGGGGDRLFLVDRPAFVVGLVLAERLLDSLGELPIGLSKGLDAINFADAAACGLAPLTFSADLLRTDGIGRMPRYLQSLEQRMRQVEAKDLTSYVAATDQAAPSGPAAAAAPETKPAAEVTAGVRNIRRALERHLAERRSASRGLDSLPRKIGSDLTLFDCLSCDNCVFVCPHDANFVYETKPGAVLSQRVEADANDAIRPRPDGPFRIERQVQLAHYADWCDECGNCDVFCPEDGGPHAAKPRLFGSRESFERDERDNSLFMEQRGEQIHVQARLAGQAYQWQLDRQAGQVILSDGVLELVLSHPGAAIEDVRRIGSAPPPAGHKLSTQVARTLLIIVEGILDPSRPNPVAVQLMPDAG